MKYGLALIEKPGNAGMNIEDVKRLFSLISVGDGDDVSRDEFAAGLDTEVYPIELEAREHECVAMGFISREAAAAIDYDYEGSGLHDYIASVLDDMDNEHDDHYYSFNGVDIFLSR